ncbi:hypothetical protein QBC47DRAFT_55578 [Echria macrotheca]|uniref:Uncharacterized protein n=1 Tax=Echria macrotheca TaxID=438768 RepID=A0AAJ0F8P3_9PEZI|nr:hypothetical protein QBC47DRAFT_55578 [Echria macrotheca]
MAGNAVAIRGAGADVVANFDLVNGTSSLRSIVRRPDRRTGSFPFVSSGGVAFSAGTPTKERRRPLVSPLALVLARLPRRQLGGSIAAIRFEVSKAQARYKVLAACRPELKLDGKIISSSACNGTCQEPIWAFWNPIAFLIHAPRGSISNHPAHHHHQEQPVGPTRTGGRWPDKAHIAGRKEGRELWLRVVEAQPPVFPRLAEDTFDEDFPEFRCCVTPRVDRRLLCRVFFSGSGPRSGHANGRIVRSMIPAGQPILCRRSGRETLRLVGWAKPVVGGRKRQETGLRRESAQIEPMRSPRWQPVASCTTTPFSAWPCCSSASGSNHSKDYRCPATALLPTLSHFETFDTQRLAGVPIDFSPPAERLKTPLAISHLSVCKHPFSILLLHS